MIERWLPIPGYEDAYEVSALGRVRSRPRTVMIRDGRTRTYRGRVLSPAVAPSGHSRVVLCADGVQVSHLVHKLVMLAFVGPCPEGLEVRHRDGDPTRNVLPNLAYGTRSENMLDRVEHGTHHLTARTRCPAGHEYTPENTYTAPKQPTSRFCRQCRRERNRARKLAA